MNLQEFIAAVKTGEAVSFGQTQAVIAANYRYQPTAFSNGIGEDKIVNAPGTNEGSCRLFAFAQIHQLDKAQTLGLFGDYYREVLDDPQGEGHLNIRNFIKYGWSGIHFEAPPLTAF